MLPKKPLHYACSFPFLHIIVFSDKKIDAVSLNITEYSLVLGPTVRVGPKLPP